MAFMMSLQATSWRSVIKPNMIQYKLYVDTLRLYGEHYLLADRVNTEGWWIF